jgi:metal-responsive CopG/Arc/MetJ family transcriptional regulator
MANIKTAISIERPLFENIKVISENLNISRSKFFALAAQDFIQRYKNKEFFAAINKAYDDLQEPEAKLTNKMKIHHLKAVKEEW